MRCFCYFVICGLPNWYMQNLYPDVIEYYFNSQISRGEHSQNFLYAFYFCIKTLATVHLLYVCKWPVASDLIKRRIVEELCECLSCLLVTSDNTFTFLCEYVCPCPTCGCKWAAAFDLVRRKLQEEICKCLPYLYMNLVDLSPWWQAVVPTI